MTRRSPAPDAPLSRRALNRAFLARQWLLARVDRTVPDALEHLVGLQAQAPQPPYLGLWTRLEGFAPESLSSAILDRTAVRVALMRGTVHLVTARDCLALRPVVQPVLDRSLVAGTAYARALAAIDARELASVARAILDDAPRDTTTLGELLGERFPGCDPASLVAGARAVLPLVQIPPRGLWEGRGRTTYATAERWLDRPLERDARPDAMVLRYLGAFGPASVADAQTWSGLGGLAEAFERLRPRLVSLRDESGRELFDLPDAPRPGPDAPAPVRFLPEYDNALLSHADRARIISDSDRKRIATRNGIVPGTVLVDGFVRAAWKVAREKGRATLRVDTFAPLSPRDARAVEGEAARLLALVAPDVESRVVEIAGDA